MHVLARTLVAFTAIWLCAAPPAKAGSGGEDLTGLQKIIGPPDGSDGLCAYFGMNPCPQMPTLTQAVLEIAGLESAPPEMVRALNSVAMGLHVDAANPSRPPALNPITGFPIGPGVLSSLRPLAFISARDDHKGPAQATHLYDPEADSFFYAVASGASAQPDTLFLFYDDPSRTDKKFKQGQVAAKISLPLTVLNSGVTERAVPAILQYKPPGTGGAPCSASTVTGSFSGSGTQRLGAAAIGVNCAVVFGASPTSPHPHAIFEVAVPLLVTGACNLTITGCTPPSPNTDPAYFFSLPVSHALPNALSSDDLGFTPAAGILGVNGKSIGIAPTAGPLGSPSATVAAKYALCASLPREDDGKAPVPSVAAFYAIATDGEVLLSAPLPPVAAPGIVCPF